MTQTVITGVEYNDYIEVDVVTGTSQVIEVNTSNTLVIESDASAPRVVEIPSQTDIDVEVTTGEKGPAPMFLGGAAPQPTDGTPGDVYIVSQAGANPGDLYQKSDSGWGLPITNVRGATGTSGVINTINGKTGTNVILAASDITTGVLPIAQVPTGTTATTVALGNHNHDSSYVSLSTTQTIGGNKTFSGIATFDAGGQGIAVKSGPTQDHTYISLFARSASPTTRSGFIGYGSAGSTTLSIYNEAPSGGISLSTPGTISLLNNTNVTGNLSITGSLRVGTSATAGYVLTTDADGNASWQAGQDPIPLGTTAQYYRGDKTWQALDNAAVTLAGNQTVGGIKTFSAQTRHNGTLVLNGVSADIIQPDTTGGWARGFGYKDKTDTNIIAGIGLLGSNSTLTHLYLGFGATPWDANPGLRINPTGAATFSHGVSAASFTGSGAALTALSGSNISTGTVADARLSSNVALLTGAQTLSGAKTFSAIITANAGITSTAFTGPGSGITALNASNISSGTVPIGNIPTGTTASTVALGNHNHDSVYGTIAAVDAKAPIVSPTFSGVFTHNGTSPAIFSNTTTGQGIAAASLQIQGESTTPAIYFKKITGGTNDGKLQFSHSNGRFEFVTATSAAYRDVQALTFYGSGAGLTSLNGSSISTGTVPQAALKPNTQKFLFTTGNEARPTGTTYVDWQGPVQPVNSIAGDTWINTGV